MNAMDLSPASPLSPLPRPARPGFDAPGTGPGPQRAERSADDRTGEPRRPEAPPPVSRPDRVGVEISRREHGIEVLRYVDRRSGLVIHQNPPEQVLNMVTKVIESIQNKERSRG